MPIFDQRIPAYKKTGTATAEWKTFRKGLNLLLRPTEIGFDEMAESVNLILTGSGVPTGRWGTELYFDTLAGDDVGGLGSYVSKDESQRDLLALTYDGKIVKKSGQSYTLITGQSYPTGSTARFEQLGNKTYIVCKDVALTEYDGTNLSVYATISPPTGLSATNFSGATGSNRVSYKVVAISSNGGQTTPSTNYVLQDLPTDLSKTEIRLFWTAPSCATYSGFEVYRGSEGNETFLASTPAGVTYYVDKGNPASETILPPVTNTTGGVKSKIIAKYKDRLLVVPVDDPNMLMISGRYPDHYKFSWYDGGGYIYIDPDSGDQIVGIAVQPIADRIVVYKNHSSYLVNLDMVQLGNYWVLDPQYSPISTSIGASNPDTLATVENDTFYFGTEGLYVTGYEPNFLNIIRTNEISARIRPYLDLLSKEDYQTACAMYVNKKYLLSFPLRKEIVVYDRERGCFASIWRLPFGIVKMSKFYEDNGDEKWVLGLDDGRVAVFNRYLNNDMGQTIEKTLRTNKTDFGDWTTLQTIEYFYFLFRNIIGTTNVTILLEDRNGLTTGVKSFTISGAEISGYTGYGMDKYGTAKYGTSNSTSVSISSDEIPRWGTLFKVGKLLQMEVSSTAANSNFELLKIKVTAKKHQRGSLSSSQRV
jgi:hypothetical protein